MSSRPDDRSLAREITHCEKCPRLRRHCLKIASERRKAYSDQVYWGKPVPFFGPIQARLLVVGLAPGAHGANRTGRIFTGDRSGDWLYRALHRAGFASQDAATSRDDGMQLKDCRITCVVKCAPPDNKPSPSELKNCSELYLRREIEGHPETRVFVALGKVAWDVLKRELGCKPGSAASFKHGARLELEAGRILLGSYHPSQQNTFTGRLTEAMLDAVFSEAKQSVERDKLRGSVARNAPKKG